MDYKVIYIHILGEGLKYLGKTIIIHITNKAERNISDTITKFITHKHNYSAEINKLHITKNIYNN